MAKQNALLLVPLAASLLLPTSSTAADFSKIDLNALLRVRITRYNVSFSSPAGPGESLADSNALITKGGGAFLEASSRSNPLGAPEPFGTFVMRGVATAAERARLAAAVQKAQPGIQRDCFWLLSGDDLIWDHDVIWYGKGSRRNQFRVVFRNEPDETLPECPKAVVDLVNAVDALLSAVGSHRDTEFLSTPPR